MSACALVLRYAFFALLATIANLGLQRLVLAQYGFFAALLSGTAAGLIVKYTLDKNWIFHDRSTGMRSHRRKFSLYAGFSLITTVIFWGSETAFWLVWGSDLMRELGAVIGLTIGYAIKYQLDRRYVFTSASAPLAGK